MGQKLPPFDVLQSFEVASRVLSFTRAAEELHVTPAAVSHRIKMLEDRLGTSLFHRENNRIFLTDRGQALVPAVREALDLIADAAARVTQTEGSNVLSVSLLPTFAVRWLVPRLSDFRLSHSGIDVRLSTTYRPIDFAREPYDAAVRYGDGIWPGLRSYPLFYEELIPVCSPKLLQGPGRRRRPEEISGFTLLHSETCQENWSIWLDAAEVRDVDPQSGLRFDSCLLTLQAAEDGLGIVAANHEYVARDLAAGRLVAPFDITVQKDLGWHFVCPETAVEQPKVAAFRNWLLSQVVTAQTMHEA